MTKQELVQDMRRFCGGSSFIRRGELARYMHRKDAHSVDRYTKSLTKVDGLYFIADVAEQILAVRR